MPEMWLRYRDLMIHGQKWVLLKRYNQTIKILSQDVKVVVTVVISPTQLILHHKFSDYSLHHREELVKALQNDLRDSFDHTADIKSFNIDNFSHMLSINFDVYVNSLNKDELSYTITKLKNMSLWLLHAQKVLDSMSDKGKLVVLFFDQLLPLNRLEESYSSFVLDVSLSTLLLILLWTLCSFLYKGFT
ncbi:hypothetical protein LSM04_009352 [Trypanosoma melophagium]|uniref:uncharacterized protein n=1 Tax=Trypanosoma melophagium TaxID=715481 RepID=UPI00351A822B|nr:hypothetical protein LSM04_009352 [Trypanosoma melophagium]